MAKNAGVFDALAELATAQLIEQVLASHVLACLWMCLPICMPARLDCSQPLRVPCVPGGLI